MLGAGSSLVGGTLKTEILREEALELALDGFLPFCELGEKPKEEKRSLFRELGLPYVSDPAVTRHLAAFLEPTGRRCPTRFCSTADSSSRRFCRERVADVMEHWYGQRPVIFENRDLDLAVARRRGVLFVRALDGRGLLVRGGLPRTYYIGLGEAREGKFRRCAWCRAEPKKARRSNSITTALQLVANKPVSFRLYSSLTRTDDKLGRRSGIRRGRCRVCTCTRR